MNAMLVLTNASAGSADHEHLDRALAVLRESADVEVVGTGEDGELESALDRRDGRTLVVAGGDGSLHLTISRLHERGELDQTVVGLLPLGTGNDFARSTRIPLDVEDAARVIAAGHVRDVDLIADDRDHLVVNNVHLGIGADASRYGARWKQRLGRLGYPIGVLQAAFADPYRLRGHRRRRGGGRRAAQPARGLDRQRGDRGRGTGTQPRRRPRRRPAGRAGRARHGGLAAHHLRRRPGPGAPSPAPDVERRLGTRVEVSGQPVHVSADGEVEGPITHREWRLLRNAMNVILPG